MINYLDGFAWIGGFHLALQQAVWKENINCIWFSEIDKFAKKVYQDHFPDSPDLWDITQIDIESLPDLDLVTGWFPCQDVSVAWRQSLDGWRTILVEYLLQILEKKKPKGFVFENVKWLLSEKFKEFRESVFERIREAGYYLHIQVLNTKDFWLPQNRERVFMVWYRMDWNTDWWYDFPEKQDLTNFLKEFINEEVDDKYYLSEEQIEKAKETRKGRTFPSWKRNWDMILDRNDYWYSLALTCSSFWKTSRQNNLVSDKKGLRLLTPSEYTRLQGFPDGWSSDIVSNSQVIKQMWNAVSVPVVKSIFDNLFIND